MSMLMPCSVGLINETAEIPEQTKHEARKKKKETRKSKKTFTYSYPVMTVAPVLYQEPGKVKSWK